MLQRLRVLDMASTRNGTIGFRYALAELCDALIAGDRERLVQLFDEIAAVGERNRSWIPVESFLEAVGLPLPPMATQWLEPYPTVLNRWTAHLDRYLARHGAYRSGASR